METAERADYATRFQPGNSGGPGRPKGSRHTIEESFLRDVVAAWEEHGADAIKRVARDDPGEFLRLCGSLLPKQLSVDAEQTVYVVGDVPLNAGEWEEKIAGADPGEPKTKLN